MANNAGAQDVVFDSTKQHRLAMKATEIAQKSKQRFDEGFAKQMAAIEKAERKLLKKIPKADSTTLQQLQQDLVIRKAKWQALLQAPDSVILSQYKGPYLARLDSLRGMLQFGDLPGSNAAAGAIQQMEAAAARLTIGTEIQEWLGSRRQQWQQLANNGTGNISSLLRPWNRWQQQAAVWQQQTTAWKDMLNQPERLEQELLKQLQKLPVFQAFMQQNGELARLFGPAAGSTQVPAGQAIPGLQTRQALTQELQNRFGADFLQPGGGLQQQLQAGMDQMADLQNQLTTKLNEIKNSLPTQLSPAQQEKADLQAQPLKKRFELGWNLQSSARAGIFPAMSDAGLSLGYKATPRLTTGIGIAYRFGLGESLRKIALTHEGIGLRSFIDWRLGAAGSKAFQNLWLTAGFEMNYYERIANDAQLNELAWQRSGLVGLSKMMKWGKKEGKVQVLWDVFNYELSDEKRSPIVLRWHTNL